MHLLLASSASLAGREKQKLDEGTGEGADANGLGVNNLNSRGVFKISQGSGFQKILWAIVLAGVCCGFVLHLLMLIERYSAYPVNTEFEVKTDFYEFPDVTLCSTNYLSYSYGYDNIPSEFYLPNYSRGVYDMIFDISRFLHLLKADNMSESVPKNPYNSYRDGKLMLNQVAFRSKQFPQAHEVVIFCRFNSQPCTYKNFTQYKDEEMFLCHTFTPENNTVVRAGSGNGLYLVTLGHGSSYYTDEEQMGMKPGMQVVLHKRGEKPNLLGPSFFAPAQYITQAVIDTSVEEKLNRETYLCQDHLPNVTLVNDFSQLDGPRNSTFVATTNDCRTRVMQLEFVTHCGCLATHLPKPVDLFNQFGVCHSIHEHVLFRDIYYATRSGITHYTIRNDSWYEYRLSDYIADNYHLYNSTVPTLECYNRVLKRQQSDGVDTSSCEVLCKTKKFSTTTFSYLWPSSVSKTVNALDSSIHSLIAMATAENLTIRDLNYLKSDTNEAIDYYMGMIDIYPRDMSMQVTKEDWAYPLRNFFSDLGGILGLWIGASIVTLAEVIEVASFGAALLVKRFKESKRTRVEQICVQPVQQEKPPNYASTPENIGEITVEQLG